MKRFYYDKYNKYQLLFKTTQASTKISKESFLFIAKEFLDETIKLGSYNDKWEYLTDEDSVIPYDASRFQGVIELIFEKKIKKIYKDIDGLEIVFE